MSYWIIFVVCFFIACAVNLWGEWILSNQENPMALKIRWISKPLLMFFLVLMYVNGVVGELRAAAVAAFVFGLIGDIFMIFQAQSKHYLIGALSFLVGHVCYYIAFAPDFGSLAGFAWWRLLLFLPGLLIFAVWAFPRIIKRMPGLEKPVSMIYGGSLILMAFLTLFRFPGIIFSTATLWCMWLGGQLFVLSDAVLAVDRFHHKVKRSMIWIMATYSLGQFLLAYGLMIA